MITPDQITEQLSAANPVPSVTFLAPTVDDADEFLAVVKGLDLADEADTTSRGSLRGGVSPAASDEPCLVMAGEFDDLTVLDVSRPGEIVLRTPNRRLAVVATVVAVAILLVAGVSAIANEDSEDVVAGLVSLPAEDDVPAPTPTVPPDTALAVAPSAQDCYYPCYPEPGAEDFFADVDEGPPGCEVPQGWPQVCDAESFDVGVMYAVTAGGPGLVAVGADSLEYLTRDDMNPEKGGVPSALLIADAVVWTSPDGFTWSRVPRDPAVFGGDGSQQMFDVTVGGPGLVAVGNDGPAVGGEGHAAVWTSPDGFTWTRVPHDEAVFGGPGEQRMVSVTAGGPGLVAVGFDGAVGSADVDGAVWTSPDGFTWSRIPHDEAVFGGDSRQMMLSVTAGGPGLVVVGNDGPSDEDRRTSDRRIYELAADAAVWTSPDGFTWTRVPHDETVFGGPGEQRMLSVTVGGPGLVAVGSVSASFPSIAKPTLAAVWTSPDGFTWSRVPQDAIAFGLPAATGRQAHSPDRDLEQMLSVTAGGPGLVAVGFNSDDECGWDSAVWTSRDGHTWARVPDERGCGPGPYDRMLSVTVGPSGLVAVGEEHGPDTAAVWNDDGRSD